MSHGFVPRRIALADGLANPGAVPEYGGYMLIWNGATWDRAFGAKLHDLDTGVGTEYNLGVSLRTPISGGGGSKEVGNSTDPLYVRFPAGYATPSEPLAHGDGFLCHTFQWVYSQVAGQWERAARAQLAYVGYSWGSVPTGLPIVALAGYYNPNPLADPPPGSSNYHGIQITYGRAAHVNQRDAMTGIELKRSDDLTFLSSGSRTGNQTTGDLLNIPGYSELIVILDVTTIGTGSIQLAIDGKDVVSGAYYNLLTGAAIVANSRIRYHVSRHLTAAAAPANPQIARETLPRTYRITVTDLNGNAVVYSVGYCLVA